MCGGGDGPVLQADICHPQTLSGGCTPILAIARSVRVLIKIGAVQATETGR
jgi:hypothetical protein